MRIEDVLFFGWLLGIPYAALAAYYIERRWHWRCGPLWANICLGWPLSVILFGLLYGAVLPLLRRADRLED